MRNLNNIKSYFVENNLSYDKMLGAFLSTAAEAVMVNNCIQNNTLKCSVLAKLKQFLDNGTWTNINRISLAVCMHILVKFYNLITTSNLEQERNPNRVWAAVQQVPRQQTTIARPCTSRPRDYDF